MYLEAHNTGASSVDTAIQSVKATMPATGEPEWFAAFAYAQWLRAEHDALCHLLGTNPRAFWTTPFSDLHAGEDWALPEAPPPASRIDTLLAAAGLNMEDLRRWSEEASARWMVAEWPSAPELHVWPQRPLKALAEA